MKLQTNLPQNAAFFERYAHLITSLSVVATIAQIVTGACEIGILYALLHSSIEKITPPQYVGFCAMLGAVMCAAFLQIGLKIVFPFAVRAVLYRRFKGLELILSICILVFTAALLTGSISLSWQGSKEIAEFTITKPIEKTTTASDSLRNVDFLTAQRLFTSDSATIETKYKGKLEATETEKMNEINAVERNAKGKRATTLRAELATKLAKLQADKATEIEAKASDRKKSMDRATNRNDGEAATIATDNTTAKNEVTEKKTKYKGYIGYFTLICYIVFLVVFIIKEIYHKGAKIEIKPLPSQRHFNPSVFAEFIETVKEKLDVFFRTKIQNWADKTPPQPLPLSMSALYDFKADILTDTIKIETTGKQMKVVKLPLKGYKIAAETSDNEAEKPQRQIGFLKPKETANNDNGNGAILTANVSKSVSTASVGTEKTRNCLYCNVPYVYSIHNQKYCCEAHRVAAYEARSGKAFLKKKAK
jgi:hypothetical protein